jgi:hypothetical protein
MKPRIFLGSSLEGKALADALQVNLNYDARCTVWHQAFPLSMNTIDTLLLGCAENDFAIFVFSNDDIVSMRNQQYAVARDNVVFESGLFMGMHGKDRGFIVVPQKVPNLHIPTDLLGLTMADYDVAWARTDPAAALGAATTKIKQAIGLSTWATLRLDIASSSLAKTNGITYPLKLEFKIKNNQPHPVAIESISFELDSSLRLAPNASGIHVPNKYRPQFLVGKAPTGKDTYADRCILGRSESIISWVPIDPTIGKAALDAAIGSRTAGIWHYRCCWLGSRVIVCNCEENF